MIEGLTKEFEFIFCQKILFSFKKKKECENQKERVVFHYPILEKHDFT